MSAIVIIGGGSWGSAIASSLQRAQQPVTVLARDQQTVDMLAQGCVQDCLIAHRLPRLRPPPIIHALPPPQ